MLNKLLTAIIATCFVLTITACGNVDSTKEPEKEGTSTQKNDTKKNNKNAIIVYFSWSGNTEAVAKEIQTQTGSEIFQIIPQNPYTNDYESLLDIAQQEQRDEARPIIRDTIENFDSYTTVYLGYPNWWGDMPMIMYSFLDDYDLSSTTIIPFCTSGGSGFSSSLETIKSMEPNSIMLEGLSISDDDANNAKGEIQSWLSNFNLGE